MSLYVVVAKKAKLAFHMLRNLASWIYRRFLKSGDEDPTITTDEFGFTITKDDKLIDIMPWSDVRKICLWQKGLATLDLIYAGFYDERDRCCVTDELMVGYRDFLLAAEKHFPGLAEVEGLFGWNAAGRSSNVEPLWLDVKAGVKLTVPDGYITRKPKQSGQVHISF